MSLLCSVTASRASCHLKFRTLPDYGVFFPHPERTGEVIVGHLVVTTAEISNPTRIIQLLKSEEEEAECITLYLSPLDMAQIRSLPNFLDPRLVLTHCDRERFFKEEEKSLQQGILSF
jgi:hypothetical protein